MQRTQIYLSESERQGLLALAQRSGRSQSSLIREAIDRFLENNQPEERLAKPRQGRGLWAAGPGPLDGLRLRQELDRTPPRRPLMASAANGLLVIDTDVLINYLRDQPLAASVVSIAELSVGVRDGVERQRLDAFVSAFEVLPLEKEAAMQAGLWRRQFGRSHGTGLAEALIAACVQAAGATLATLNRRHFPMLANVLVPYAKGG